MHLDGDIVRETFCSDLGFSKEDRRKNLERIAYVSKFLLSQNVVVLATFVSPYIEQREMIKNIVGEDNFVEIFVDTPVEECIKRDVKGMYAKAIKGEIPNFTGVSDPYENPIRPDLIVKTENETVEESVKKVVKFIREKI